MDECITFFIGKQGRKENYSHLSFFIVCYCFLLPPWPDTPITLHLPPPPHGDPRSAAKYSWPWQTSGGQTAGAGCSIAGPWLCARAGGAGRFWQRFWTLGHDHCSTFIQERGCQEERAGARAAYLGSDTHINKQTNNLCVSHTNSSRFMQKMTQTSLLCTYTSACSPRKYSATFS